MTIFETFCVNNNCFFYDREIKMQAYRFIYKRGQKHKEGDYYAG